MNQHGQWRLPVFSLRELLFVVTFLAVGCAALKFANDTWSLILAACAALAFLAAAVVAVVDRGRRQAFAIGFVICAGLYYGLVASASQSRSQGSINPELARYGGRFPTSKLQLLLFDAIAETVWYDRNTGNELPDYKPPTSGGGLMMAYRSVLRRDSPDPDAFMRVGHTLWMLLLGYLGGHFARFVYLRRVNAPAAHGVSRVP